jgi:two-component system, NarL family, sensor kinase
MRWSLRDDRSAAIALAVLRALLVAVIFASERLVDARRLAGWPFDLVLGLASGYALVGMVVAFRSPGGPATHRFTRMQPALDVVFLAALACTSGGAYSDARKAFLVIPLTAAFSERSATTAQWSLIAVAAFSIQAVIAGGHPTGALNSWERMMLNQDLYLAWTCAAAMLLAVALKRRSAQTQELARSRQRLVTQAIESVERERTRLAGALHDLPVQNLMAARHDLRRAERSGDVESFRRVRRALDATIEQLREEIFDLHPHVLDHAGLSAALEQVARRHAAETAAEVVVQVAPEVPPADREVLFAFGRELLGNAAKHAGATHIQCTVARNGRTVVVAVSDDGCGIAPGRLRQALLDGHIGLATLTERVDALGGTIEIATADGRGCTVRVALPDPSSDPERARWPTGVSDRVTHQDTLRVSPA